MSEGCMGEGGLFGASHGVSATGTCNQKMRNAGDWSYLWAGRTETLGCVLEGEVSSVFFTAPACSTVPGSKGRASQD